MTLAAETTFTVKGIRVPDSSLARAITELVRDTESALLFHHSSRVYYWGALAGKAPCCQIRFRTSLCGRDVSRHGPDACTLQRARALRGRRRERCPRLPA